MSQVRNHIYSAEKGIVFYNDGVAYDDCTQKEAFAIAAASNRYVDHHGHDYKDWEALCAWIGWDSVDPSYELPDE